MVVVYAATPQSWLNSGLLGFPAGVFPRTSHTKITLPSSAQQVRCQHNMDQEFWKQGVLQVVPQAGSVAQVEVKGWPRKIDSGEGSGTAYR